jgi:hypothetical protein
MAARQPVKLLLWHEKKWDMIGLGQMDDLAYPALPFILLDEYLVDPVRRRVHSLQERVKAADSIHNRALLKSGLSDKLQDFSHSLQAILYGLGEGKLYAFLD